MFLVLGAPLLATAVLRLPQSGLQCERRPQTKSSKANIRAASSLKSLTLGDRPIDSRVDLGELLGWVPNLQELCVLRSSGPTADAALVRLRTVAPLIPSLTHLSFDYSLPYTVPHSNLVLPRNHYRFVPTFLDLIRAFPLLQQLELPHMTPSFHRDLRQLIPSMVRMGGRPPLRLVVHVKTEDRPLEDTFFLPPS